MLAALAFSVTYKSEVESFNIITVFLLLFAANNVTDVALLATFVSVDVAAKAGLTDRDAEEVFVPNVDGSLPSILLNDVLVVVWFAAVAAPVGKLIVPVMLVSDPMLLVPTDKAGKVVNDTG